MFSPISLQVKSVLLNVTLSNVQLSVIVAMSACVIETVPFASNSAVKGVVVITGATASEITTCEELVEVFPFASVTVNIT